MSDKARAKLDKKIAACARRIKLFEQYKRGAKSPASPKEETDNMQPRFIEISYGDTPWRLLVNVNEIRSVNFIPIMEGNEVLSFNVNVTVADATNVTLNTAKGKNESYDSTGHIHSFPFTTAIAAQQFYETVKALISQTGAIAITLNPAELPMPKAPQPESDDDIDPLSDGDSEPSTTVN